MLVAVSLLTLIITVQPAAVSRGVYTAGFIFCLGLALLHLNRRGHTRLAAMLFAGGLIGLMTVLAVRAGGVRSPGVSMYFIIVLMAGLLLGERSGRIAALTCAALGFGLLMAERFHLLPPAMRYSSLSFWLLSCLYWGVVIVLLRLPTMMIRAALLHAEAELSERKRAQDLLLENQRLLHTMIEDTPAAVAMFDTEMRYIAYSQRWLTDYRLGNRDLRGSSHYDVFPEIGEAWKAKHKRGPGGRQGNPRPRAIPAQRRNRRYHPLGCATLDEGKW